MYESHFGPNRPLQINYFCLYVFRTIVLFSFNFPHYYILQIILFSHNPTSANSASIFCFTSDKKFDAVVASEVIEHVDNPTLFIQTVSSLLKAGIFLHINHHSWKWTQCLSQCLNFLKFDIMSYFIKEAKQRKELKIFIYAEHFSPK